MQGNVDIAEADAKPDRHEWFRTVKLVLTSPLSQTLAESVAIILLVPVMLAPAFWNGFPIIFYDTGAYLLEGLGHVFLPERPPVYSLFLDYGGARASLWLVALYQAVATSFVMVETIRAVAPRMSLAATLGLGAGLVVFTSLPWYVGQIEPDCFAAITVLTIYLLTFHGASVAGWRKWSLLAIAGFSVGTHSSHLLLAFGLVFLLGLYRGLVFLRARRLLTRAAFVQPPATGPTATNWSRARLIEPLIACVVGLGLIVASNFELTGDLFVSRAGPDFVFARALQSHLVMRLLDDTCPASHYRLCAYKEVLPRTADQWLWGRHSPFNAMGRFTGSSAEMTRIIWATLERYPIEYIEAAAQDALVQFYRFKTGDQIEAQEWVLLDHLKPLIPNQMDAYLAARQQRSEIDFHAINWVHVPVGFLSLFGLCFALFIAIRRGRFETAIFLGFVLLALVINAVVCGTLSGPHNRYQSRLIWLAPFALVLIAVDRPIFALRGLGESGT